MASFISLKTITIFIFILTYILILTRKINSLLVVFSGIGLLFLIGAISLKEAFFSINFNVLGVFLGTMVLSHLFIYSEVPHFLASKILNNSKNVSMAFLGVCLLSGFISSFTENVATVLIVAPIALKIAKIIEINPVPLLIGVSLSSNLQGTATLIGDSPSIILAMEAGMNFNDFFWMRARPGIFFAVELGAVGAFFVLWLFFKRYKDRAPSDFKITPKTWIPTLLLSAMVLSLVFFSFLKNKPTYGIAGICLFWAMWGVLWHKFYHKESISLKKDLDWYTFFFLVGIFILVGTLNVQGIIKDIAASIGRFAGKNVLFAYVLIVGVSVLVSAFVDNIPYTMAMIPVAKLVSLDLGVSMYPFLFGLLIGTCLGGNITPFGASCNIVTLGILRKEGFKVRFIDFFKIGIPFTLTAVILGASFIWFFWMR
ncbi:MAG: SLC13 family permease [Candidatus Omnitrophica bacterium]|nr:SLC13 family permease [Candidatus Omnitrophota bacterium]